MELRKEKEKKLEGRIKQIERMEWKEREYRRKRNLIIKGVMKEKKDWK